MNLPGRWKSLQTKAALPNLAIAVIVVAIIVFAIVDAVRRGYLSADTAVFLACFVPAVVIHEVSHGVVANWCGDDTAKRAGRLTLNPLRHVDPVGSVVMPIVFAILPPHVPFGWAKPVPVAVNRLRSPRNQAVLVGLAGPASNIILASLAGLVIHILYVTNHLFDYATLGFTTAGTWVVDFGLVNIILAVFNLIPIPPLDGSSLVERLIPNRYIAQYYQMRFFMMIIVLFVVLTQRSLLNDVFGDVETWYYNLFV